MSTNSFILQLAAAIFILSGAILLLKSRHNGRLKAPLPPGPKRLPLIGNLRDMPPKGAREWEHWAKHRELYGPISSVTLFGTNIIIVNDGKAAIDLLEKRGGIHASRPYMVFLMELCGWFYTASSLPYGPRLRSYRQRFHRFIGTQSALARYSHVQEVEAHRFLLRVLEKPETLLEHVRTEAGAIILKMAYGYTIQPHGTDPLVAIADLALAQFSVASMPGAWLVDTMPLLKYVPDWVPGAGFKKTSKFMKQTLTEAAQKPMDFVKHQMTAGTHEPSYVSDDLEKAGGANTVTEYDEHVTKWSAASLYTGGADTVRCCCSSASAS